MGSRQCAHACGRFSLWRAGAFTCLCRRSSCFTAARRMKPTRRVDRPQKRVQSSLLKPRACARALSRRSAVIQRSRARGPVLARTLIQWSRRSADSTRSEVAALAICGQYRVRRPAKSRGDCRAMVFARTRAARVRHEDCVRRTFERIMTCFESGVELAPAGDGGGARGP